MVNRGALILFSAILLLTGFTCEKTKYKLLTAKSDSCLMAQNFLIESDKKEIDGWIASTITSKYFCDAIRVTARRSLSSEKVKNFETAVHFVSQKQSCEILIAVGYISRDSDARVEEQLYNAKEFFLAAIPGSSDYKIVEDPTPEQDPVNWCKK